MALSQEQLNAAIGAFITNNCDNIRNQLFGGSAENATDSRIKEALSDGFIETMKEDVKNRVKGYFDGLLKDCLLYTSPSPRDLSTSRMPSSA